MESVVCGASIERGNDPVTLSVIVPVYNSSYVLERCLTALSASTLDPLDVWVVDDGSTEPIESIVRRHGFSYLLIDGPGGPARARNRGVARAMGNVVVFVDADVCVHTDTLRRMAERFASEPSIDALVGTYDDKPAHNGFLSQYKNLFHHYVHQDSDGEVSTFWSGCGAMRRDLFLEFGGFDEIRYRRPAIEDIELGTWISASGHRIVLDRRVQCQHLKRWTLRDLIKTDVFDRGIPWTRLMLRAGAAPKTLNVKQGQRISVVLVYLTLLSLAGAAWFPWLWATAAIFATIVTVLNLRFYHYFAARRGWWFTLRTIPLHWLYFCCCGVCVVAGTLIHHLRPEPRLADARIPRR